MKLIQTNTYKRTVRTDYPHPERADETVRVSFVAEFNRLSTEQLQGLPRELSESQDKALLGVVLAGVHGVEDEAGSPIPPNVAAAIVKADPFYTKATIAVWQSSLSGVREKN